MKPENTNTSRLEQAIKMAPFTVDGIDYILKEFPNPAMAALVSIALAGGVFQRLGLDPDKVDVIKTMKDLPLKSMETLAASMKAAHRPDEDLLMGDDPSFHRPVQL